MNHVITPHSKLLGVIEPVLNDMPAGTLRHALFRAFWDETASLLDIEDAFARVTARRQAVEGEVAAAGGELRWLRQGRLC